MQKSTRGLRSPARVDRQLVHFTTAGSDVYKRWSAIDMLNPQLQQFERETAQSVKCPSGVSHERSTIESWLLSTDEVRR